MTHPMDVVKIRMQVSPKSFYHTIVQTFHEKRFRGFYTGLTAAILRQVTYTTTRLGIYYTLLDIAE
jgi:dicarboxylate transporter 10